MPRDLKPGDVIKAVADGTFPAPVWGDYDHSSPNSRRYKFLVDKNAVGIVIASDPDTTASEKKVYVLFGDKLGWSWQQYFERVK